MKKLAIVFLLAACREAAAPPAAPPPAPAKPSVTAAAARAIVADSPEFSEYQFTNAAYSLPLQRAQMNEPAREVANTLKKAGWISFDGAGNVVLTSKAESDKRFLVRPNGVVDIVPLAKKEFGDVTAAHDDVVEFTWTWKPNEIGKLFGARYEDLHSAKATLLWDGSAWSVMRIEEALPVAR